MVRQSLVDGRERAWKVRGLLTGYPIRRPAIDPAMRVQEKVRLELRSRMIRISRSSWSTSRNFRVDRA